MNTIKWGIIGTGNISSKFAAALNSMHLTKLAAVASRDIHKAEAFAERFHIEKAYGSYEMLAMDPEIDVIYIGTPHTEHKANTELCIRNFKAVLCEKPFTINKNDSEYLVKLAKENKVFLMEAMWTKFLPVTVKVKEWLQQKRIGEVRHLKISFGFSTDFDQSSRLFSAELGGGALLDVGIYPVSYASYLLNRLPDDIVSCAIFGRSKVDEQNVIIMKYNDGILADLSSAITADNGQDAVITGNNGRIVVPKFWMADKAYLYDAENNLLEICSEPFHMNGYEYEAEEVNRCLRKRKLQSKAAPLMDTIDTMRVLDTIRAQWGFVYPQERTAPTD